MVAEIQINSTVDEENPNYIMKHEGTEFTILYRFKHRIMRIRVIFLIVVIQACLLPVFLQKHRSRKQFS